MAYSDTPLPTKAKRISQPKIRENFQDIQSLILVDHVDFGTADSGKHQQATFKPLTIDATHPAATTNNDVMLYNNAGKLYFRPTGETAGVITNDFDITPSSAGHATKGYDKLPSGLLLCWGSVPASGLSASDTFAKTFKAGSPFQVITSASGVGGGKTDAQNVAWATSWTTTTVSFSRSRAENSFNLRYLAIGLEA